MLIYDTQIMLSIAVFLFHVLYYTGVVDGWTFLTNHSHVLLSIASDPDIRLRDIAVRVGITERAAQRIVNDLAEAGYVIPLKIGRRNRYQVDPTKTLRHPIEKHCQVQSLIDLLSSAPHDGNKTNGHTEGIQGQTKSEAFA